MAVLCMRHSAFNPWPCAGVEKRGVRARWPYAADRLRQIHEDRYRAPTNPGDNCTSVTHTGKLHTRPARTPPCSAEAKASSWSFSVRYLILSTPCFHGLGQFSRVGPATIITAVSPTFRGDVIRRSYACRHSLRAVLEPR